VTSWYECEVAYVANEGDGDWFAEVVQTDPAITEEFVVDMLGVWQNPIRWEVTNGQSFTVPPLGGPDPSDLSQEDFDSAPFAERGDVEDAPPGDYPSDAPFRTESTPDLEDYDWQTVLWPLGKPNGYLRFHHADHFLRVRVTALRAGAVVGGWTVVPWYIESSMVMRAPIDYNPPWGVSDQMDLLDTGRKPIFKLWSHYFPQKYSTNLYGYY
jgi:hypothetical protein